MAQLVCSLVMSDLWIVEYAPTDHFVLVGKLFKRVIFQPMPQAFVLSTAAAHDEPSEIILSYSSEAIPHQSYRLDCSGCVCSQRLTFCEGLQQLVDVIDVNNRNLNFFRLPRMENESTKSCVYANTFPYQFYSGPGSANVSR